MRFHYLILMLFISEHEAQLCFNSCCAKPFKNRGLLYGDCMLFHSLIQAR